MKRLSPILCFLSVLLMSCSKDSLDSIKVGDYTHLEGCVIMAKTRRGVVVTDKSGTNMYVYVGPNFNYEDYNSVNNTYTISSTLAIIFGTVGIVLLIIIIILKSIGSKNHLPIPNTSNPPTIHTSNLHNYCLYCNGNLADGRDKGKCPNCGAPTSRR